MLRPLFALALGACAASPATLATPQAPPAPSMQLTATPVYPGATTTLTVTGAAPGATLYLFRGDAAGRGPCAPDGSVCVGLVAPTLLGAARANASGVARLTGVVPDTVPFGSTHLFQAVRPGPQAAASTLARTSNLDGCAAPAQLAGADLTGLDLSHADLSCADLSDAVLVGADLSDAYLYGATLDGAWLDGADLTGLVLRQGSARDASARATTITDMTIDTSDVRGLDLTQASGDHVTFRGADVDGLVLVRATLTLSTFDHTPLTNADARWADLSRTVIPGADHTNFDHATFVPSSISSTVISDSSFRSARFEGDLRYATLTRVDFTNADMADMRFLFSTVTDVDFTDVAFMGTLFQQVEGHGAIFDGADLSWGVHYDMDQLTGTSFVGATCEDGLPASAHAGDCFFP